MSNKINKLRQKEANKLFKIKPSKFEPINLLEATSVPSWMTRAYKNNRYVVMIDDCAFMKGGTRAIKALIQKHDGLPITNHWREMQNIKNEVFGKEVMAIEYYPKESELIDEANIYWLFIFEDGIIPTLK